MFQHVKLNTKFNTLLIIIFIFGSIISGIALSQAMQNKAEAEVRTRAEMLIQNMSSVRTYTSEQIKPLLQNYLQTNNGFISQTVPAFSAREVFENFRQKPEYKSFLYKEATLNPTNLRDKANQFETEIVRQFREQEDLKEVTGYTKNQTGEDLFYLARPLVIKKESCLQCHSTPEKAPISLIEKYGDKNGFGWKIGQVVAAQTIYIPASNIFAQGMRYLWLVIGIFISVFTVLIVLINRLLNTTVIKPIKSLTQIARKLTNVDIDAQVEQELKNSSIPSLTKRNDEPGQLAKAFQHLIFEVVAREESLNQAKEEIKWSEIYFRSLIEQASDIITIINRDLFVCYTSPSVKAILGYEIVDFLQVCCLDLVHLEDRERVRDFFAIVVKTPGIAPLIEFKFLHKSGNWRIVEAVVNNLLNDPVVEGIVVNFRDITERKKSNEKLRLLESVVVNANDAIVITEAEPIRGKNHPKIVYVNEAFSYMTGYSGAEIIGRTPRILQGEKTDRNTLNSIRQALEKWMPINVELINYRKDGTEYWVELNILPIADDTGWYTHWVSIEREITERKLAEQELRQSEASIRSLYQVIAKQELNFQQRVNKMLQMGAERFGLELGILSKIEQEKYEIIAVSTPNPQSLAIQAGDIFDLSQTYCQVTVKSASQPVSFSQAKNTLWQNHPCYRQTQLEAYLGTTVIVAGEIYGTLNFSSRQPLLTPFKPVQAELIKLMAQWLGAEIERQQSQLSLAQARDEAEAASRAKSDFLATMSHEIRTPMNAVIGMTGLLLNTQLNEQQQDFVQTIRSSGDALLTLINDILDFSKIEAGKLEFEEQPFELHSCIEAALSLLAPQGIEKNLELAYLISPQTPKVIVGDVTRLRQILVNLISNAVKFTPQGEVVVYVNSQEIDKEKYEIEFAVKDTGIGIPPDKMDRLFQSFSQVDASTTRQYGGTGLGLAISQRLCQMMGGKMWVTSQVGVGSTFYFTIIAPLGEEATINQPQISLDLAGKKLLIVDDNATNRQILTLQAQNWGMLSCAVESGEKALHLLNQAVKFDLAILDMQMPGIDGVNLARKVRKSKQWGNLPLIMLTSLNRQEIISQSQDINFAAILNKPIQQNQLYRVISQVFGSKLVKINKSTFPGSALPEKSPQINSLRILLAEDIVVNQKVATLTLQQLGYRADVVSNGLEVLEALRRQTYDVVLMDVQMPEMDGITATKAIVNQYKLESRPRIIAMTANAMRGDKEKCLAAGMNDYIPKPIRLEDLKNALEKCQPLPTNTNSTIDHQTATTKTKQQKSYQTIDTKILDNLTEIVAGDQSLLTELIESYFTEATTRIAAIKQAIEQNNPEQLTQAAHALKSASANVGAIKLSQMCRELEEIGRSNTIENTQDKLINIKPEFEQVKEILRRIINN